MSLEKLEEAKAEFGERNFEQAQKLFEELLSENLISPYIMERTGATILLGDGEDRTIEDAEALFLRAHEIAPRDPTVLWQLAHLYDAILPRPERRRHFANLLSSHLDYLKIDIDELLRD